MSKKENMNVNITIRLNQTTVDKIDKARKKLGKGADIKRPEYIRYVLKKHLGDL